MMFACCHPALPREVQTALTLKMLCGFSVTEIARAFLAAEATIAQRLVRAKRKFRQANISLETPAIGELRRRREGVWEVLYLLFNEGYNIKIPEPVRTQIGLREGDQVLIEEKLEQELLADGLVSR